MQRDYVIVCTRHKGIGGALLFWGTHTEDEYKRCFGGYTNDFDKCEKYTKEECVNNGYRFPFYGTRQCHKGNWRKKDDFCIRIDQLSELGYRAMTIYYR